MISIRANDDDQTNFPLDLLTAITIHTDNNLHIGKSQISFPGLWFLNGKQ